MVMLMVAVDMMPPQASFDALFKTHISLSLASGALHLVPDAPQFPYPVCAVSSSQADPDLLGPALSHLRKVAPSG